MFEYIKYTLNIIFEQNQIDLKVIKLGRRMWEEIKKQKPMVVGNHFLSSE